MIVVLAHGAFDILHSGHIMHLATARELGDKLIVSVTAAEYVLQNKGRLPYFDDFERRDNLMRLRHVDEVLISFSRGSEASIRQVMPNIYVKGKEYEGRLKEQALVETLGGKVVFLHHPKGSLVHSGQFSESA